MTIPGHIGPVKAVDWISHGKNSGALNLCSLTLGYSNLETLSLACITKFMRFTRDVENIM